MIPIVFLASVIGVSQTDGAIPRILRRFESDLERVIPAAEFHLPNLYLKNSEMRVFNGGIYTWRPSEPQQSFVRSFQPLQETGKSVAVHSEQFNTAIAAQFAASSAPNKPNRLSLAAASAFVGPAVSSNLTVILGTATGFIVSALVPPEGFDCRHVAQIFILLTWLVSAQLNRIVGRKVWALMLKDLASTLLTMIGIIVTQIGVFNQCVCYTLWGKAGLALPGMPKVAEVLVHRLNTAYPAVTFTSIGIHLMPIPLAICYRYRDAVRVYLQRDNGESNFPWLWKLFARFAISRTKAHKLSTRPTLLTEEGKLLQTSYEMHNIPADARNSVTSQDTGEAASLHPSTSELVPSIEASRSNDAALSTSRKATLPREPRR